MELDFKNLLVKAIQASLKAGEEILKIYNKDFNIEFKADKSPLTEADLVSNNIIVHSLQETNIPIISEENKLFPYEIRKEWSSCWIIDPIDGTKEFIKKNGEFTVNVALVVEGVCKLGIIYVPATKLLYYTDENKTNAFKTIIPDQYDIDMSFLFKGQDFIKPRLQNRFKQTIVGSRSHMNDATMQYVNDIKQSGKEIELICKGSSLKFCLVAEGKADVYPRFAPTMEWDTAAGQAICEAVGLKVVELVSGNPMKYNRENLLNNYFLVTQ